MPSICGGNIKCADLTRNRELRTKTYEFQQIQLDPLVQKHMTPSKANTVLTESNSDAESDILLQNWDNWMDIESELDSES